MSLPDAFVNNRKENWISVIGEFLFYSRKVHVPWVIKSWRHINYFSEILGSRFFWRTYPEIWTLEFKFLVPAVCNQREIRNISMGPCEISDFSVFIVNIASDKKVCTKNIRLQFLKWWRHTSLREPDFRSLFASKMAIGYRYNVYKLYIWCVRPQR